MPIRVSIVEDLAEVREGLVELGKIGQGTFDD